jgi:hypothetical protein
MNKKFVLLPLLILMSLVVVIAATPKPGPMAKLTLVNKMVSQPGYISLKGLTNFYTYFLTARAYAIDVQSAAGPVGKSKDTSPSNLKTEVTTYVVRQDMYEITVTACGFSIAGMIKLHGDSQIVFPSCVKGLSKKQEEVIDIRSICIADPSLPLCKRNGFVLTTKGGRGEEKNIKVRQPPIVSE